MDEDIASRGGELDRERDGDRRSFQVRGKERWAAGLDSPWREVSEDPTGPAEPRAPNTVCSCGSCESVVWWGLGDSFQLIMVLRAGGGI